MSNTSPLKPLHVHLALASYAAALLALALLLPPVAQMAGYHDFADQRTLWGIPYAMDVLTNAPFALAALAIAWALHRARNHRRHRPHHASAMPLWWHLVALTALGFAATAWASSRYHLAPSDATVLWDRLAMGLIFAGIVGLGVRQIAHSAASASAAALTLLAACIALPYWYHSGNFTPWSVLQGGGMLLLLTIGLALQLRPHWRQHSAPALGLLSILGWYTLCKICELADHALFTSTAGLISGHSLKHLLAALAAWPIVHMVLRSQSNNQSNEK